MSEAAREVEALYESLLEAWNERDAAAMAACYTTDGVQIGFDGSRVDGGEAVRRYLEPIFRDHPTARYVARVRDCRMLGADYAMLTAVAGMLPPGSDRIKPENNALHTIIAARDDGAWRVVLFQNTPAAYHGRDEDRVKLTAELQAVADTRSG
jgi:uncharacterized protein (TIGR02246 family)